MKKRLLALFTTYILTFSNISPIGVSASLPVTVTGRYETDNSVKASTDFWIFRIKTSRFMKKEAISKSKKMGTTILAAATLTAYT